MPLPDLVPARMLNEFAYCPRLFYLEWVQGEWAESADTEEGRFRHRRVDEETGGLPLRGEADGQIHAKSVTMSAERLGLIARIDLLEGDGEDCVPIEYKGGSVPDVPEQTWETDRVQLCVQALILRENGYRCHTGQVCYAESQLKQLQPAGIAPGLVVYPRLKGRGSVEAC